MGVVYLAYCGSWQLSLYVPCFCAFISSIPHLTLHPHHFCKMFLYLFTVFFFKARVHVCVRACMHVCVSAYMYVSLCVCLMFKVQDLGAVKT